MFFELTDSIVDDILFSMEDQGGDWFFDSANKTVASKEMMEEVGLEDNLNENDFYSLPNWTSDDGFELMEDFMDNLHTPGARSELRQALSGGRGVFRNFKNVLKKYPEVERRWFLFKNEKMKARVTEWYNGLRESWGLERLAEEYTDEKQETDELVLSDFVFGEYDFSKDWTDVERGHSELVEGNSDVEMTKLFLVKHHSNISEPEKKSGFICRSQDGEFVGCLLFSKVPSSSGEIVVFTDFYIIQNYRGLGIGRMLLSESVEALKNRKIRFCFASGMLVPETFRLTLEQFGFKKNGPGFICELSA